MGHTLGFALGEFLLKGLIAEAAPGDPVFLGAGAANAYGAIAPPTVSLLAPLENIGGGGTRFSHWRESVFHNELMTGFLDRGLNPLSALTAGAMRDLGNTVNDLPADHYDFPSMLRSVTARLRAIPHTGPLAGPVRTVDARSRIQRTLR
jgi:hypothetical protein